VATQQQLRGGREGGESIGIFTILEEWWSSEVKKNKRKNCGKRQFGEGLAPPAAVVEKDEENKDGQQQKNCPRAKSRKIRRNSTNIAIGMNKIIYMLCYVCSVCLFNG
jgi:hypothetical protein